MGEFFGITHFGFQDVFKPYIRPDYTEPTVKPKFMDLARKDGYAYGSNVLITEMRKRSIHKPVGPTYMYKFPITTNMDYGWVHEPGNLKWAKTFPRIIQREKFFIYPPQVGVVIPMNPTQN